jgi:hypothetical protein
MTHARRIWIAFVLAASLAAGGFSPVVGAAIPIAIEPRIVDAAIERVSLEKLDVAVHVAVRASHRATIKAVSITDAFVEDVPVSIAPLAGEWQLEPGQDLVLPQTLRVSAYARDAIGTQDLGAIVRQGSVTVRANVEVDVATPWPGRLLFLPSRQTVVKEIVVAVPIATGPSLLQPFARLGADLADAAQRVAAPFIDAGMNRLPARRALLARVGGAVATVTTTYTIASGGARTPRSQRSVGFWWTSGVFCTTRDALEPWRFDVGDASALQAGGARLDGAAMIRIGATGVHPAVDLPLGDADPRLPSVHERRLFALTGGTARRIRVGDREDVSNVQCVRLRDGDDAAGLAPAEGAAVPLDPASADIAAFAHGRTMGVVWTGVLPGADGRLALRAPVHRYSFGSPLVGNGGVVGVVASPTTAWPVATIRDAAARAPRLTGPQASPGGDRR